MDGSSGTEGEVAVGHEPKVIARMPVHSLHQPHRQPQPESLHVSPEEERSEEERHGIGQQQF